MVDCSSQIERLIPAEDFFCKRKAGKYGEMCTREANHKGACRHGAISSVVKRFAPKAGAKLQMDTYQTPGDKKAVKNRAPRCFPDKRTSEEIKQANIRGEHSICIRRRFSSTPEDCFDIHVDLATQIVSICVADNKLDGVFDTLKPEEGRILNYLLNRAKVKYPTGAACRICKKQMKLENFHTEHGTSEAHSAQLGHIHPYIGGYDETAHVKGNVQWIHRDCNIIQGEKTEDETFNVLAETLRANGYEVNKND